MKENLNDSHHDEGKKPIENSKPLMMSVIIMGVLIIIGVVVLIGVIAHRAFHPKENHGHVIAAQHIFLADFPENVVEKLSLPLKTTEDEHIFSVTSRPDGLLAVTLVSREGSRILLWSPEQARLVAELDLSTH